jgi:hypothetical protein
VPRVLDGTLQYTLMEMVSTGDSSAYWVVRQKTMLPASNIPTTSDTPSAVVNAAEISNQGMF